MLPRCYRASGSRRLFDFCLAGLTGESDHSTYVTERSDNAARPKPIGHEDLNTNWIGAGHLKIGDKIKQADGTTGVVANVTTVQQTQEMFNLTVDEAHTFYVGTNGWLVHNGCDPGVVFRGDRSSLNPANIFENGIAPKGSNTNLLDHVSSNTAGSIFVSTSKDMNIAKSFAGKNGYVVVIDNVGSGSIDTVKALGSSHPFPEQLEFAFPNGIPGERIIGVFKIEKGKIVGPMIPNPARK